MQHQQQKKFTPSQVAKILHQKRAIFARVFGKTKCDAIGLKHQMACNGLVDDNFGNLTMLDHKPKYHFANFLASI